MTGDTARHPWAVARVALGAVAVTVNGIVGAATAHAAPDYSIFLAAGDLNDAPPVRVTSGLAIGLAQDDHQTNQIALSNCVRAGGHQCVLVVTVTNGCAAVAANDFGDIKGASDASVFIAQKAALAQLQNHRGAHLVVSGCTDGHVSTPNPPPPAALPS